MENQNQNQATPAPAPAPLFLGWYCNEYGSKYCEVYSRKCYTTENWQDSNNVWNQCAITPPTADLFESEYFIPTDSALAWFNKNASA